MFGGAHSSMPPYFTGSADDPDEYWSQLEAGTPSTVAGSATWRS